MKTNYLSIGGVIIILLLLLSGCKPDLSTPTPVDIIALQTAAIQTYVAQLTQYAEGVSKVIQETAASIGESKPTITLLPSATRAPSHTPIPSITLAPIFTSQPSKTATVSPTSPNPTAKSSGKYCNWVEFVSDITISDGTRLAKKAGFTKTWRLRNIGTCTWTTDYFLVFINRDLMGAPKHIALPADVKPGGKIDLSVDMVAPAAAGEYVGNWMLMDADGNTFGTGPNANAVFWVRIIVVVN